MAALSSKAFGKPATREKYNGGTELNDDLELNYYETYFRNYDAQLGRFTGVDKMAQEYLSFTPYQYGNNNPLTFNDPTGLKSASGIESASTGYQRFSNADYGTRRFEARFYGGMSGEDVFNSFCMPGGSFDFGGGGGGGSSITINDGWARFSGPVATKVLAQIQNSYSASYKNDPGSGNFVSDWWQDITNNYIDDPIKLSMINGSLSSAWSLAANKIREVKRWNVSDQVSFKNAFGANNDAFKNVILTRLRNLYGLLGDFQKNGTYKTKFFETTSSSYAHVYSSDSDHEIFLDQKFWSANLTGQDSKAGTIIHEMSHFRYIGNTDDYVNGLQKATLLSQNDPAKALYNADNFEYYLEGLF